MKTKKSPPYVYFIAAIVFIIGAFVGHKLYQKFGLEKYKTVNFVTAAPLDMTQMESISKFRSCSGHDYSGHNIAGEVETGRSMKHYASPLHEFRGTEDKVKVFAPFDGKIINN